LIWAKGEIESPDAWKNFLDKESYKISEPTKPYDAMVVFDSSQNRNDFVIISKEKICKIRFSSN
tara:strand:- start:105 stop:296 length:192 start_codon:yes stop_codon:yes gene_type:complete